jgi:hypothetical protein
MAGYSSAFQKLRYILANTCGSGTLVVSTCGSGIEEVAGELVAADV